MQVAIAKQGFWRAVTVAAVLGAALVAAAPAAQAHWWVHRSFVRPWHHIYYHPWRFYRPWHHVYHHRWGYYRPWWHPVFFRPYFAPPVVTHRVVVVHAPPRVVYRTRIVYRTAAVIHHPVVHHPAHHASAIHYSARNCGCQN